jgi:hypothetical protein
MGPYQFSCPYLFHTEFILPKSCNAVDKKILGLMNSSKQTHKIQNKRRALDRKDKRSRKCVTLQFNSYTLHTLHRLQLEALRQLQRNQKPFAISDW